MTSREIVRMAGHAMARQPARSLLTMLGLAIGVVAFIAMVGFGEGARRSVLAQFEALGTNLLKVSPSSAARDPLARAAEPLTDLDLRAIEREATAVNAALPVARVTASIHHGARQRPTTCYGTLPRFAVVHLWNLAAGGMFDRADVNQHAKVCVLGQSVARALFAGEDPLGATVTLGGALPCRVIGVLEEKGYSTGGSDLDDLVLLPVTTFSHYLGAEEGYSYLEIEPLTPDALDAAKAETAAALRRSHRLGRDESDDFTISSPLEVIRAADRTSRILSTLLASIAAVSLLVGGIGIMNIQLVSVAERTEEIGIRAALGASPRQILAQFLAEAIMLSAVGSLAGVVIGVTIASVVAGWMAWPRVIQPAGVIVSVLFGIAVGVAFGYLPARRAARLDPIEALRHE